MIFVDDLFFNRRIKLSGFGNCFLKMGRKIRIGRCAIDI